MTKHLVRIISAVMTTLLGILVLWQFRNVVIYILISLILAATLRPLVKHLESLTLVNRIAWIFLYLAAAGSIGIVLFITGKSAISEIQLLGQNVTTNDAWILPVWLEGSAFQQILFKRIPPPGKLLNAISVDQGLLMLLPAILDFMKGIGSFVTGVLIILFLSFYWSTNQIHFERLWLSLLSSDMRKQARNIWRIIESDVGGYIRGQFIQSLLAGLLLGAGYWLLGSQYLAGLALMGALLCMIPVVGAVLAIIPPLLVGLLTNTQHSLLITLYTLLILIAILIWVKPRLFNRRWDNSILTVVILIALADALGIIGIIITPPISAVCQILWNRLISHRAASGAAAELSDLKTRLNLLRETVDAMNEPHLPLVTTSMERISDLIFEAEPILKATLYNKSSEKF